MHMKWRRPNRFSFDDFCVLVRDGQKADLIEGVIYMASPDSWETNLFFGWLFTLIGNFVSDRELGCVVGSRVAFHLEDDTYPEPDIAFVHGSRAGLGGTKAFDGPPDVAIEIVSPDSVDRDYVVKREKYRQSGVPEYWIIDPLILEVTFMRLDSAGRYREVRPRKGVYRSEVIEGFWFKPAWFWQEPLPKSMEILNEILGERE